MAPHAHAYGSMGVGEEACCLLFSGGGICSHGNTVPPSRQLVEREREREREGMKRKREEEGAEGEEEEDVMVQVDLLGEDLLQFIFEQLPGTAHFQFAATCRAFWDVVRAKYLTEATNTKLSHVMSHSLALTKWAHTNGCPWDERMCAWAAGGGHLEVLQWARANHCPWDERTCACAAGDGHLDVLQWARANGCPWDKWTCVYAEVGDHLEVLEWARKKGCPE